jgi:hypothetical protein
MPGLPGATHSGAWLRQASVLAPDFAAQEVTRACVGRSYAIVRMDVGVGVACAHRCDDVCDCHPAAAIDWIRSCYLAAGKDAVYGPTTWWSVKEGNPYGSVHTVGAAMDVCGKHILNSGNQNRELDFGPATI